MRKYIYTIFFIFLFIDTEAQQSPLYSLYMFNGLVLNPAYAGSNKVLTSMLHYRKQWTGIAGAPTTYTLSMDTPLRNEKFNLGGVFSYDSYGIINRSDYMQSFAYRLPVTAKGKLAFGFQAGFAYQHANWGSLNVPDDDAFSQLPANIFIPKIGIGVYYAAPRFYLGASIPQIAFYSNNQAINKSSSYITRLYCITSGYTFSLSPSIDLLPSILLKYFNSSSQLDMNGIISYKKCLSAGISYRSGNAALLLAEVKVNQFRFGYAYDYYLNGLKNNNSGSHELLIKYEFRYIVRVMDPRNFY